MHTRVCAHQKVHMYAAELDSSVSHWPSGAQHVREREWRKQRQLEREREREKTVWTTSMLTLHFSLIHHLKQKGHWGESSAGQGWAESGDSCLHADNPWHANTADMQQQHSAGCQAAQLDTVPFLAEASFWNGTGPTLQCTEWQPSNKPGMFPN